MIRFLAFIGFVPPGLGRSIGGYSRSDEAAVGLDRMEVQKFWQGESPHRVRSLPWQRRALRWAEIRSRSRRIPRSFEFGGTISFQREKANHKQKVHDIEINAIMAPTAKANAASWTTRSTEHTKVLDDRSFAVRSEDAQERARPSSAASSRASSSARRAAPVSTASSSRRTAGQSASRESRSLWPRSAASLAVVHSRLDTGGGMKRF